MLSSSFFPDIPHFKEVVIMATVCDHCGHKTNEVKSGGGIEPQGTREGRGANRGEADSEGRNFRRECGYNVARYLFFNQ